VSSDARMGPFTRLGAWRAERRLRSVLRGALGVRIGEIAALRSPHGHFYRVETEAGRAGARVPREPEVAMRAVETAKLLERAGVRHPKLVHVDAGSGAFPHGLIVQEWLEGVSGAAAIGSGAITERALFALVGAQLRTIQQEPVASFGLRFWLPALEGRDGFLAHEGTPGLTRRLRALRTRGDLPVAVLDPAIALARQLLAEAADRGGPVLVHGDIHAGNVLLTDDGPVLIDWLNAHGGCRVADFARSRWQQSPSARSALIEGYGGEMMVDQSWKTLEAYHSLRFQLGLIDFFAKERQWAACRAMLAALEDEVVSLQVEIAAPPEPSFSAAN
jgi:aminoglycoside phosphotransferase (APT) family kinase protein